MVVHLRLENACSVSASIAACPFLLDAESLELHSQTTTVRAFLKCKSRFLIMALLLILPGFTTVGLAVDNAPAFRWAKQVDGIKGNSGESIAVDSAGNTYVTGLMDYEQHQSIGTHTWSSKGGKMFLAKYDSTGKQLWLQKTGGGGKDYANGEAVTVDSQGHIYVAGCFSGAVSFNK